MRGKLFIICASSGAGKTTLARELVARLCAKHKVELVIGYTSRPLRKGEVEGEDYHFLSTQGFKQRIEEQAFLEWSFGYGHYYGSSIDIIDKLESGVSCVVIVGIRGVQMALDRVSDATTIWIAISDVEVLKERLSKRGQAGSLISERLEVARSEAGWVKATNLFQHSVINDVFDEAIEHLSSIVFLVLENKENNHENTD